jgi:hypothetical protein
MKRTASKDLESALEQAAPTRAQWDAWSRKEPSLAGLTYEALRSELRTGDQDRKDTLLRVLVRVAHAEHDAFAVVAACLLPALRHRVARYAPTLDRQDAFAVVAGALFEAVTRYHVAEQPGFVASALLALPTRRLRRAVTEERSWTAHTRGNERACASPGLELSAGAMLAFAVDAGVMTAQDAQLILDTRTIGLSLRDAARRLELPYPGPAHRVPVPGVGVSSAEAWHTPLGDMAVGDGEEAPPPRRTPLGQLVDKRYGANVPAAPHWPAATGGRGMNSDATPAASLDAWLDPTERQAAARDAYLRSVDQGAPLSAAALAAQFDRSPRWAQDRIAEARRQRNALGTVRNDNGSHASTDATSSTREAARQAAGQRAQHLDTLIVALVALVAAAASYQHQRTLATLAGEGWLAWALPISVDGMMLATGRSILRRRRVGISAPFLSWFGFALGLVASVAANVAAAEPTPVSRLIAAWPPVALFIAYETLAADHGEFVDHDTERSRPWA